MAAKHLPLFRADAAATSSKVAGYIVEFVEKVKNLLPYGA
jgi:hypothetical protein